MSKPILSLDVESRSPTDLKRSGAYRYWEDPYTEVLCAAWAINDDPVSLWLPGESCPKPIEALVAVGGEISGWNVLFERQCWNHSLGPKHNWPLPRLDQYRDTAAQAAAQALPRRLEKAAEILRMPENKDTTGHKLMMKMAKPRKRRKGEAYQTHYWYEGDLDRLG